MANHFISTPTYAIPGRISLEYIEGAFDCWYALGGRTRNIPEYLWQLVIKVLPEHRQNKVLAATRLTYSMLNKHISFTARYPRHPPVLKQVFPKPKQHPSSSNPSPPSPIFVKVFLPLSLNELNSIEQPQQPGMTDNNIPGSIN